MKEYVMKWWYDNGTCYAENRSEPLFGCENHQDEQYHLSHQEAVDKINEYVKRLSNDKFKVWHEEIKAR